MKHLVLTLLILLAPCALHAQEREVVISSSDWPPMIGKDLPHQGFLGHLIARAFARQGMRIRYEFVPWARAYYMVVKGEVDASAYYYESDKRKTVTHYSDPLITDSTVFFHFRGLHIPKWEHLRDLSGLRIGVINGNTYTEEFWALGRKGVLNFFPSNTPRENFQKLARGRIDIYPSSAMIGKAVIRQLFPPDKWADFDHDPKPLIVRTGHLLFSKSTPDGDRLVTVFNEGLAELRRDGTYARMLRDLKKGKYDPPPLYDAQ